MDKTAVGSIIRRAEFETSAPQIGSSMALRKCERSFDVSLLQQVLKRCNVQCRSLITRQSSVSCLTFPLSASFGKVVNIPNFQAPQL